MLAAMAACITPYGADSILITQRILGLGQALTLIAEWQPQDFSRFGPFEACLSGKVLGAFRGHTSDRVGPLHDPERVGEGLEVELEALAVGASAEPGRKIVDVGRRQGVVSVLGREVDDRRRAQPSIEMVVEQGLRRPDDGGQIRHRPMVPATGTVDAPHTIDLCARGRDVPATP